MDDDWEKIADDQVTKAPKIPVDVNKWAGEDEDDPKDSWEDALEDEKKDEEKVETNKQPKKSTQQRIAEKEKARKELEEKRRKERDEDDLSHLTPEERAAEKLRLQMLQEEEYTRAALDTLGLTSSATIDSFNPKTKEDFTEFAEAICKKVSQFKTNDDYVPFLDELVRNLCAGLSSVNIRKIKSSLDNLYLEKQKLEKGDKPKKKPAAGKVKAKLRVEDDDDYNARANYGGPTYDDEDYDDFM